MKDQGLAHMGMGTASGEDRAIAAAKQAIESPLLETTIDGAKGVLINVTGGKDLGLLEVSEATDIIRQMCDPDAMIIFGAASEISPDIDWIPCFNISSAFERASVILVLFSII